MRPSPFELFTKVALLSVTSEWPNTNSAHLRNTVAAFDAFHTASSTPSGAMQMRIGWCSASANGASRWAHG